MFDINTLTKPYALKFLYADERDPSDLSDAALERAFENCVRSPKPEELEIIRSHIRRLAIIQTEPIEEGQMEIAF